MPISIASSPNELRTICELPTGSALPRAARFLADLVKEPAFLGSQILPLLEQARHAEGWFVARRYDAPDGAYSMQVFVWPPGTGTRIHDHSSWGAYACALGTLLEERYDRLDDGTVAEYARLRKAWQLVWSPEDGASTVLPGDDGIHRVGNPGTAPAISVHVYGPRTEDMDGRDYDPSRDYVCDRN
jgi:predicted metal-dependent enzyme (double-stranded beta helix superfamily)